MHELDGLAMKRDLPHFACAICIDFNLEYAKPPLNNNNCGMRCLHCARTMDPSIMRNGVARGSDLRRRSPAEKAWRLFQVERILSGVSALSGFTSCPTKQCTRLGWVESGATSATCEFCHRQWPLTAQTSNTCSKWLNNFFSYLRIQVSTRPCPNCQVCLHTIFFDFVSSPHCCVLWCVCLNIGSAGEERWLSTYDVSILPI
jgi:hypothetical protein